MVDESQNPPAASEEREIVPPAPSGSPAVTPEVPEPKPEQQKERSGGWLNLVMSLIALGVAGYATYQVYLGFDRFAGHDEALSRLDDRLTRADRSVVDLERAQQTLRSGQEQFAADLDDRLGGLSREIAARSGTSSQDWILAEAEYLIRLANQRVLIEREVTGAIGLLRAADEMIRDAGIVSALPVREAIAGDIARLEATGTVDAEGIYLQLGALASQVDALPRQPLNFEDTDGGETPAAVAQGEAAGGWRDRLSGVAARVGERLASLVDYRTGIQRIEPILPPEEEYYLRQNLKLRLELAQLALLKGRQGAYEQSLRESIDWVNAHFDATNPATSAMLASLAELARARIARDMPDISASLNAMREYMSGFHRAPDRVVEANDGEAAEGRQ